MMPAVKHFDPVMGVDIHILIIPMVGPVPIPHPHVAMILDPMDFIPVIGATVLVGPMRRGTAGTCSKVIPHIPMGAPFAKPPMNESEIFMGSAMVLADGAPMTFTALPVLSCHDIGMIAPPRKKPKKTYGMVLPTSLVTGIPAGLPVLVGGPPTIDMMGMAMAGGMKALGGAMGKLRKLQKSSKRMKKVSDAVHKKAKKAMDKLGVPPNARNKVHKGICTITGHPVDVASGKLFTEAVDFQLPGPLPLTWERTWYSTSTYNGPLGYGWHHNYDLALAVDEKAIAIRMSDGRPVAFPRLDIGESAYHRAERMMLIRDSHGYALDTDKKLRYRFFDSPIEGIYRLKSVTEKILGSTISFAYSVKGDLLEITDSADRFIRFEHDQQGRIQKIFLPTPDADSVEHMFCAVEYQYDGADLVRVIDALKYQTQFLYRNHLLVQETLKSGLKFYFKYDGEDHHARCVETWGDGELYYRKLEYPSDNQTLVYDSKGCKTEYHHNGSLPETIVNPEGYVSYIQYNDYGQIIQEINEVGVKTEFAYDDYGNQITKNVGGEQEYSYTYDANQNLISVTDPIGGEWKYGYDSHERMVSETDPLGGNTLYTYGDASLAEVVDASGTRYALKYDRFKNIREIQDDQGVTMQWVYDRLGRVIEIFDHLKNKRKLHYDLNGRVVQVREFDGALRKFQYDALDNMILSEENDQRIEYEYTGINRVLSRSQDGSAVHFQYDTEEKLVAIRNQHGSIYRFAYDRCGHLIKESGFDGVMREYYRDPQGRILRIQRPGGRFSEYRYNDSGLIDSVKFNDGKEDRFKYRADGYLIEAQNDVATVQLERNALGWITEEKTNQHWIKSEYDALGYRTKLHSSSGLQQTIKRNRWGQFEQLDIQTGVGESEENARENSNSHTVTSERNQLGLEMERTWSGGIQSRWRRDSLGRPVEQQVHVGNSLFTSQGFKWGANGRLLAVMDKLNRETVFQYNVLGNLVGALGVDGTLDKRMPDAVGNLFRTDSADDREYGPTGQLLIKREKEGETRYQYDAEGNLISKTDGQGKQWRYQWNGAGLLQKVIRPDDEVVEFSYDSFGRRTMKKYRGTKTFWLWDGNHPLHEWKVFPPSPDTPEPPALSAEKQDEVAALQHAIRTHSISSQAPPLGLAECTDNRTTWVFEPDSFTPIAKIDSSGMQSIVTDYLGVPLAMFDTNGQLSWAADRDSWRGARPTEGEECHCPFRWPGQYEDEETGLFYNRFRYYDPDMGQYISQDPMRVLPRLYGYPGNPFSAIDPFGLVEWVDPNAVNYSQGYVTGETETYEKAMKDGSWDWDKKSKKGKNVAILTVAEVDGQMVSFDNRRLLAAQNAGLDKVPVQKVNLEDIKPGTSITWGESLEKRLDSKPKGTDLPKIKLPRTGGTEKPKVVKCK